MPTSDSHNNNIYYFIIESTVRMKKKIIITRVLSYRLLSPPVLVITNKYGFPTVIIIILLFLSNQYDYFIAVFVNNFHSLISIKKKIYIYIRMFFKFQQRVETLMKTGINIPRC